MQTPYQNVRFALTVESIRNILSQDLSGVEISHISAEILTLMLDGHNDGPSQARNMRIAELIIERLADIKDFSCMGAIHQLLEKISNFQTKSLSRFKPQSSKNLNRLLIQVQNEASNHQQFSMIEEFQDCVFLKATISKLIIQDQIFDKIKALMACGNISMKQMHSSILFLGALMKMVVFTGTDVSLKEKMLEIMSDINDFLQKQLYQAQGSEIITIVLTFLNITEELYKQPTTIKDRLMYKLDVFNGLVRRQCIQKGLQFFNALISSDLQEVDLDQETKDVLQNSISIIFKSSTYCEASKYLLLVQKSLQTFPLSAVELKRILNDKDKVAIYELVLQNYKYLSRENVCQILQNIREKSTHLSQRQTQFFKKMFRQGDQSISQQVLRIAKNEAQRLCLPQNNMLLRATKYHNYHQQNFAQIKNNIQNFLKREKSIQNDNIKRQIQAISVSILNSCNLLSKDQDHECQGARTSQLKQIEFQEYFRQSLQLLRQSNDLHLFQVLLSLLNYFIQEFQQQLFPLTSILSQLCSMVTNQIFDNTYSIIKKFHYLTTKFAQNILFNTQFIDLSKLSVKIISDLLGSSNTQLPEQQQFQLKMDFIASIIEKSQEEYQVQNFQAIISYLETLPFIGQKKLGGIIINVSLIKIEGLLKETSCFFVRYLHLINNFTERLCRIKSIRPELHGLMYNRMFKMLDALETNPDTADMVIKILLKIDNQLKRGDISAQDIKYLKDLSNIPFPKYSYLINKLLACKNNEISIFRDQFKRYSQEILALYMEKCKNRGNSIIDCQMRALIILMNEFIADCFQSNTTKDLYSQIGEINLFQVSRVAYCNQESMKTSSFMEIAMQYLDNLCTNINNLQKMNHSQGKMCMFFHYLKGQISISSVQDMERISQFIKTSQSNTAVWIFMINYVNKSKENQILYFWQKFKNGDLKLLSCVKYILLFESNENQFNERLQILLATLQNLQVSAQQTLWRRQIILILFQISKIEEDPFGIEYFGALKRICIFFDKYFMHEDCCKQLNKFHNEDIETFNSLIQTMSNISKAVPISGRKVFFDSMNRLLQMPTLQSRVCLKLQNFPVGLIDFHENSMINVIIQLLSSSDQFRRTIFQANFEPNSFCGQFQKLLMDIMYGNLSTRNCFQLIRSTEAIISMKEGGCGFIKNLLEEVFQLLGNQQLTSLFRCSYRRTKGCFCANDPHEQIVRSYHFPIESFIDEEMPPQNEEISITTSKYQIFCQYCFLALIQTYQFYQMPKYMILWQETTKNIRKSRVNHTIKFSRSSTEKQKTLEPSSYKLTFLVLAQKTEYLCAKRIEQSWYLIKNDVIKPFSSLEQLLADCEYFKGYQLVAKVYEVQKSQQILHLQQHSQSSMKHFTTIIAENSRHFIYQLTQGQTYKQMATSILEQYLQDKVLMTNQDQLGCKFTLFVQLYLQNYLVSGNLAQLLQESFLQIFKNMVMLIQDQRSFNVDRLLRLLRSNRNKKLEVYEHFYCAFVTFIFEQSYKNLNMIGSKDQTDKQDYYQNCRKTTLYGRSLLNKIIQIIDGPKTQSLFPFAINILLKCCKQIKIIFLCQSILDHLLQNSIISILITRFNHQLSSHEIDSLRFPELYRLCRPQHIQDGNVIINMIQVTDSLLRYKYQQKVDAQTEMRERLITPIDERAIVYSDFIEIVIINISESSQNLKIIDSILGYYSNTNRQSQKKKLLCRIITIFLRLVEAYQQDNRVRQHSIMLEFILRHTSHFQELETLLGYQFLDVTLTTYKSSQYLQSLDLFSLIHEIQSVYKIFMIQNLLKFMNHTQLDQFLKIYSRKLLSLTPIVDQEYQKIKQNPSLIQIQSTKIASIFDFIYDSLGKLKEIQLQRKSDQRWDHFCMKEGQFIHLENKSLAKKESFKKQQIEVCLYTADTVVSAEQQERPISNKNLRNTERRIILSILFVEITCFSQESFQQLIKIKVDNVEIKTFFVRDSKKAHVTSKKIKEVKKISLLTKQDNKPFSTLDNYAIMIE